MFIENDLAFSSEGKGYQHVIPMRSK